MKMVHKNTYFYIYPKAIPDKNISLVSINNLSHSSTNNNDLILINIVIYPLTILSICRIIDSIVTATFLFHLIRSLNMFT